MKITVIDQGHKYQLLDGQEIRFIKKEKNPKNGEFELVWVGTTNEELLEVLIDRTNGLNEKLHSPENDVALFHMKAALTVFMARTAARTLQNVEATPEQHQSALAIVNEAASILNNANKRATSGFLHMAIPEGMSVSEAMSAVKNAFEDVGKEQPTASRYGLVSAGALAEVEAMPKETRAEFLSDLGAAAKTAEVLIDGHQSEPNKEQPYEKKAMQRYIDGEELSVQDMVDLEGFFSWLRNEKTKVPGEETKPADEVAEDQSPVAASLIGAHDGSAFPAGLTSGDRHAAFTQAARQERGDLQPKAAWAFPTPDTGPETNAGDPPCNDPDHPIHDL